MAVAVVLVFGVGLLLVRTRANKSSQDEMWGKRWQLVALRSGDAEIATGLVDSGGGAIYLDARRRGSMQTRICNQTGGKARIVDGHLETSDWFTTAAYCSDPLHQLVRFKGAKVEASGDRLKLTTPGKDGAPAITSLWRPAGSLPPDDAIRGRQWMVTEIRRPGEERTTMGHGFGPTLDLLDSEQVTVVGCGPSTKQGSVVDGRIEVVGGPWQERMVECRADRPSKYAPFVRDVLDAGGEARRDGERLRVESSAGAFASVATVGGSPWDLWADPHDPSEAQWLVVDARGAPGGLVGSPVLTATINAEAPERTIAISGCGDVEGAVGRIDDDDEGTVAITTNTDLDLSGCSKNEAEQAEWVTKLLASDPTLYAAHNRAVLRGEGGELLLMRLS